MGATMRMAVKEDLARHEATPLEDRYQLESTYQVLQEGAAKWPDNLQEGAAKWPDNPAVTFQLKGKPTDKAHTWTYAEMLDISTRAANLFRSLGADETNSVALILPNLPETLAAMFAAQTSGIVNPINPLLEPSQIAAILRDSNAKIVVTLRAFPKTDIAQNVAEALKSAPGVDTIIEVDMLKYISPPLSWLIPLIRPKVDTSHGKKVLQWKSAIDGQPGDKLSCCVLSYRRDHRRSEARDS